MAPVLQCPDCSTRHPLDVASNASAFRCQGCGRVLKVPERFRAASAPVPPTMGAAGSNGATLTRRQQRAEAGVVPFWARLGLWIVAVPAGFLVVFGLARAFGFLTSQQLQDVFLEDGWNRFWPVARVLPFVALVTASIVHFSVLGISRWRIRHAHHAPTTAASPTPTAARR